MDPASAREARLADHATASRLRVLVVDDEPDVRELMAEFFRDHGCEVGSAVDGRAAIAAVERDPGRYHLVLVDLHLPGADGLSVLRAVRLANPSACVVIVTGYASLDSAVEAVRAGAYDYLAKPFSTGQLQVILRRVSDRLELETENRLLARQLRGRASPNPATPVFTPVPTVSERLDRIDGRLRRIEQLLEGMTAPAPR